MHREITDYSFWEMFTIDQLDKFKKVMKAISFGPEVASYDIEKEEKSFVEAYFSKIFSTELSSEEQENMTDEEKR